LTIATIVIGAVVWQYLLCPQLTFKRAEPFHGEKLYNPYADISSSNWVKCNFHAHVKAWGGLTNGNGSAKHLAKLYGDIGYDVPCISDYQKINTDLSDQRNFISAYEHGYNIGKVHQLVIGADKVTWADFIFPQTRSNKQWILDRLSGNGSAVILNHPESRSGYNSTDVSLLRGYDCIEIMTSKSRGFAVWDAALSSGVPCFGVANDDVHNLGEHSLAGSFCTWLSISELTKENLITSLKMGKGYSVRTGITENDSHAEKIVKMKKGIHSLKKFTLAGDTLTVEFSDTAHTIQFIAQNGRIVKTDTCTSVAKYIIRKEDQYVRTAAWFKGGIEIFLNPVFRYSTDPLHVDNNIVVNNGKTLVFRCTGILLLIIWAWILAKRKVAFKVLALKRKSYHIRPSGI
jgi:hypothetical protein